MKKAILYIVFFVIITIMSNYALQYSICKEIDNQSPYYLSFASIGANLLESRLDCWAKIKLVSNKEDMEQSLIKVLTYLDLPADKNKFLHQENTEIIITQYELLNNEQKYLFILQTNKKDKQSYLIMTAINPKDDLQLRRDEKKLKKLYECKSYYMYKGSITARPDDKGLEKLLQVEMKGIHADINEVYRQDNLMSMTGYSLGLHNKGIDTVEVAGKKCNVQAAIRRNKVENKTEVFIGFPFLLNDY